MNEPQARAAAKAITAYLQSRGLCVAVEQEIPPSARSTFSRTEGLITSALVGCKDLPDTPKVVRYHDPNGEWSAVYCDGNLVPETVGDHYHSDDWISAWAGVEERSNNSFLLGGNTRSDVGLTLQQVEDYEADRVARYLRAAELKDQAAALLAEAEGLLR